MISVIIVRLFLANMVKIDPLICAWGTYTFIAHLKENLRVVGS